MKLNFCANLSFMFQETSSLLERYVMAKQMGFRGVECAFPYDFSAEEVAHAKTNAQVQQILINVFPGDVSNGELGFAAIPGKEEAFQESLRRAIRYAKALECSRIHIMSGVVDEINDDNIKVYEKNIRHAASILEKENIVGLIEPINPYSVPKYFMNSYERGLHLVKSINSPNLKIMMDLFHLQLLKGNLTNNIKELLPHVGHIQIAQVPNRNEPNTPGEINYQYIFSLLVAEGYDGWIGLEYKPKNQTQGGLKWLAEFGVKI